MTILPPKLNEYLVVICLIIGTYAAFRRCKSGGYGWTFLAGICAYMVVSGIWQIWLTRKK